MVARWTSSCCQNREPGSYSSAGTDPVSGSEASIQTGLKRLVHGEAVPVTKMVGFFLSKCTTSEPAELLSRIMPKLTCIQTSMPKIGSFSGCQLVPFPPSGALGLKILIIYGTSIFPFPAPHAAN